MPHVTFIHGIANKPSAEALYELWLRGLSLGGLDLRGEGVTSEMVYWADVLYEHPLDPFLTDTEAYDSESLGEEVALMSTVPASFVSADERAFIEGLTAKLNLKRGDDAFDVSLNAALERVPLPWSVKKRFLKAFVRDAHHYLFDIEHEPRPGTRFRVQTEIRRRALEVLQRAPASGPHVVVAHSLGSVIAYDLLQRVAGCPPVHALLTIGSPLGIDEIQDRLRPEWTRPDGYPSRTVRERWVNIYDPLDLVCLLNPRLANDYRREGSAVVKDLSVTNTGSWRHSYEKYARQVALTGRLGDLLSG